MFKVLLIDKENSNVVIESSFFYSEQALDFINNENVDNKYEIKIQDMSVSCIAKQYLNETDWMITRKFETGEDVPSYISEKRSIARIDAGNIKELSLSELICLTINKSENDVGEKAK